MRHPPGSVSKWSSIRAVIIFAKEMKVFHQKVVEKDQIPSIGRADQSQRVFDEIPSFSMKCSVSGRSQRLFDEIASFLLQI